MEQLILALNIRSTTTKFTVFENRKRTFLMKVKHPMEQLEKFKSIEEQFDLRKSTILDSLEKAGINLADILIVVGRGGLLKPLTGGVYRVNEAMIKDIHHPMAQHESNLGALIAYDIAKSIGKNVQAIVVDPTCVDEMDDIARISGMPELPRRSLLHTLNQREAARRYANFARKKYDEINVIVVHMGGGISVGLHSNGRIIDVNNALNGDGPMSPLRSGGVPAGQLVELCFSGKFTQAQIMEKLNGKGGLYAYLGTNNGLEVEKRIEAGDKQAELVYKAIAYQVSKEIGALSTVLKGNVESIIITGGLAYSNLLINEITDRVSYIAEVKVYPGEDETETLALNGYMALNNEIEIKEYK